MTRAFFSLTKYSIELQVFPKLLLFIMVLTLWNICGTNTGYEMRNNSGFGGMENEVSQYFSLNIIMQAVIKGRFFMA